MHGTGLSAGLDDTAPQQVQLVWQTVNNDKQTFRAITQNMSCLLIFRAVISGSRKFILFIVTSHAKNKTDIWPQDTIRQLLLGRENTFMNTIMSIINVWTVASTQAVIEKCYPATGEIIAEIQHTKSAMLDKVLWHTLEIFAEAKAKYV